MLVLLCNYYIIFNQLLSDLLYNQMFITFDTGRHGPLIHPVAKWVPGIWTTMAAWLFTPFAQILTVWDVTHTRQGV